LAQSTVLLKLQKWRRCLDLGYGNFAAAEIMIDLLCDQWGSGFI
jgi:hypothetical protein